MQIEIFAATDKNLELSGENVLVCQSHDWRTSNVRGVFSQMHLSKPKGVCVIASSHCHHWFAIMVWSGKGGNSHPCSLEPLKACKGTNPLPTWWESTRIDYVILVEARTSARSLLKDTVPKSWYSDQVFLPFWYAHSPNQFFQLVFLTVDSQRTMFKLTMLWIN